MDLVEIFTCLFASMFAFLLGIILGRLSKRNEYNITTIPPKLKKRNHHAFRTIFKL